MLIVILTPMPEERLVIHELPAADPALVAIAILDRRHTKKVIGRDLRRNA